MATPPLPASILNKIKARSQSVRWAAVLREIRIFSAHCCNVDSDTIMGVSKQPVAITTLSPNPVCLGNAVTLDFTGSYAPGSAITAYYVDWGEGAGTEVAAVSGNTNTYAAAGEYTITATVEEGTGLQQSVDIEVNVIDCTNALLLSNIYASTDGSGVYYWE